jgi:hypothetical protein
LKASGIVIDRDTSNIVVSMTESTQKNSKLTAYLKVIAYASEYIS